MLLLLLLTSYVFVAVSGLDHQVVTWRPNDAMPPVEAPSTIAKGEPLTDAEYSRQLLEATTPTSQLLMRVDPADAGSIEAAFRAFELATTRVEGMTPLPARTQDHAMLVGAMRSVTSDLHVLDGDPVDAVAGESLAKSTTHYHEALGALGIVP